MHDDSATPATAQDGSYPRPQLVRDRWVELSGAWEFDYDDADAGIDDGWMHRSTPFSRTIIVPFPPESERSGIGDTTYHRVLWYRRTVTPADLLAAGHSPGRSLVIHFGAVDYAADVWVDGQHVVHHAGGHTPFSARIPPSSEGFEVVVRVEDDPTDLGQPRGKQDWQERAHVVWYDRTSGIWQPVWLESVPSQHLAGLSWRTDVPSATATLSYELAHRPAPGTRLHVRLSTDIELATLGVDVTERRGEVVVSIPALRNGQARDGLLWSPDDPVLVDAAIRLDAPGHEPDTVSSYLGFRSVSAEAGLFLLNERPYRIRGVLSQGYWPDTHLAAPSALALRAEVELIKELGFTTVRVHQKIEDPRFLYWADRLGLLVWEEMPSAYEFSAVATERLLREWTEAVRRDVSHPSVVVWVPFNESWGVQEIASSAPQRALVRAMVEITRALDGTRLIVSNDGWEHTDSDLFTVHDYENDSFALLSSYGTPQAVRESLDGIAPHGRRMAVGAPDEREKTSAAPVVLSEFGGVSIDRTADGSWGYRLVESDTQLEHHLAGIFAAVGESSGLAGWCYTQLTDTAQETNGLADENRVPKLPAERVRAMVTGRPYQGAIPPIDRPVHEG
ncbi:MAG: glycoside hydrolase family 2 [Microbacterium hominis]|jgi:beta-galactosidase/beta-glucuronidase|uniref:glycoside hydrolase family 2 TIM barrel-domain containing protein n=1 Tax=Microbacterium aurum TaxID=36805 RepID=UPI000DB1C5FD|nr:glycoside hydrolase family 2 TIM barrel-domain containing protein [Microbacterium aurum]MBZ6372747.1 glycoside hydrolase family 2 [Microbacterium hominis]PZU43563.1 MAG: glycoside hydrolase family 2 [Microbacterium sp.]